MGQSLHGVMEMREYKYFGTVLVLNSVAVTLVLLTWISWGFSAPGILDGLYEVQARSLGQGYAYLLPGPPQVYYHDTSMFHGRAYLYFGPLPSIVLWVCNSFFTRFLAHYVTAALFLFCFVYAFQRIIAELVGAALQAETGTSPWWCLSSLVLLWGLLFAPPLPGTPFSFLRPNFYIYQQQILFGLGLGLAGLLVLAQYRPRQWHRTFAVAGLLFALASSVRVTWLPVACAVLAASLVLFVARLIRSGRKAIVGWEVAGLFAGVSVLLFLFFWNYVRFWSPADFGVFFRQNCADDNMFRVSTGFFSLGAKFHSFLTNLLTYYTSPEILEATGLQHTSFAIDGFLTRGFFSANPQWLLGVVLMPLALYRAFTAKRALLPLFSILLLTLAYVNVVAAGVPPAAGPRYFMEFYPFIMLVLLAVLLAALPSRAGIFGMITLLSLHFVYGGFPGLADAPNLRLLDSSQRAVRGLNADFNRDPALDIFVVDRCVWPTGAIGPQNSSTLTPYNAMGVYPTGQGPIKALDVAAVYIIPEKPAEGRETIRQGVVELRDVRAYASPGRLEVYWEGVLIGSLQISPDRDLNGVFDVPARLEDNTPYQIMMVFLPEDESHLPPHPPQFPPWQFSGLSLRCSKPVP